MPVREDKISELLDEGRGRAQQLQNQESAPGVNAGVDQAESYANDPKNASSNIDDVRDRESSSSYPAAGSVGNSWAQNYTGKKTGVNKFSFKSINKKKSTIGILLGLFGVGGGFLVGFLGPASMLVNLTQNMTLANDSSSTSMQRRFTKIFGNMTDPDNNAICKGSTNNKMKCRVGRLSNSAIRNLDKKGVTAIGSDGKKMPIKRLGYPSENPARYQFDIDGKKKTVNAKDLKGFLLQPENRKYANSIMGRSGAFNMRYKAWTGKHINSKLWRPIGANLRGGFADGKNKGENSRDRLAGIREKIKATIPGSEKLEGASNAIRDKAKQHVGKAKKGGSTYTVAVAGCVAVRAPAFIASGVAAVQLLQVMPMASDMILSPGSMTMAGDIQSSDVDAINTTLTNQAPNENGDMKSALDSKYLLSAMGVNKAKPPASEFSPGYSILTGSLVENSREIDEKTRPACNVILSPAAMWTAVALNTAVTAAASATIVGGIIKIGVGLAVGEIATRATSALVGETAEKVLTEAAQNDKIPNAEGEALGDVLGIGALAVFSSGGMARNLPTLSESQVVAYDEIRQENMAFNREMDIASLSPFDTSSRYTFLGSIVHSTQMAFISKPSSSPFSMLGSLFGAPLTLASNANATLNQTQNSCGYAKDFNMETDSPSTTPAINVAGLPCTGITPVQDSMSTSEALELLTAEGWLDNTKDIPEDATVESLLEGDGGIGYIKKDTPLYEFIVSCGNSYLTGDYLFNSSGCIASQGVAGGSTVGDSCTTDSETGEQVCASQIDMGEDNVEIEGIKNQRSVQAMSVFLLDFQIAQSVNGFDEDDGSGGSASNSSDKSTGSLVTGEAKELAKQIVASSNVTGDSRYMGQIKAVSNGDNSCYINPTILQYIATMMQTYKLNISSLNRRCTGVLTASGVNSYHYREKGGHAVDFSQINGVSSTGSTAEDIKFLNDSLKVLPSGSGIGQSNCRSSGKLTLPPGFTQFNDSCNHNHIQVPVQ